MQDIVIEHERFGQSAEEIARGLPHLTLAQIRAALAFFFEDRAEVWACIHEDESFADRMRRRGYDCTTTADQQMIGARDEHQSAIAVSANRVIITADLDFLRMASSIRDHPGIVFWTKRQHFGQLIAFLDELCLTSRDNKLRGLVHFF
ncbi:MAG: DUF5615 family PIN-like protein [Planctomycetaceae bacterium]